MTSPRTPVTGADASWLRMDRADNPMLVTAWMAFEDEVPAETVVALLRDRLIARFPKFGQRIARDASGLHWEDVPGFDPADQMHDLGVPAPGGQAGLERLVGQRMSTRLDPDLPPWFVDRIDLAGRTALLLRLHHVLADGISLARVLLELADGAATEVTDTPRGLAAAVRHAAHATWDRAHTWFAHPEQMLGAARFAASSALSAAELLALPADPSTVLRGPLGARKLAVWLPPVSLDRVKEAAHGRDATVNDLLVGALALGLRRYLVGRGDDVAGVRTFVPVNLRPLDAPIPRDLGNQFGLVLLELPLGIDTAADCLAETRARMNALKQGPQALVTYGLLQAMGAGPDTIEDLLVRFFGTKGSLITTNVPGPRERVSIAGHEVTEILAWVPQSSAVSLGVSLISYAGELRIGIASDARRVPDPGRLAEAVRTALSELGVDGP